MKNLELNQMEVTVAGSDCLGETVSGGISGAIVAGLFTGGAGIPLGWFAGAVGGFISCAINQ